MTRSPFTRFYLLFFAVVFAGPFVPLVVASFAFRWGWPDLLPSRWWWEARGGAGLPVAWDFVFSSVSGAVPALLNTVVIALAVAVVATLLCLPAAYVVATEEFRGKRALELLLLTPLIVPEMAVGLGMLVIFLQLGLTGSYAGVVLAHLVPTLPYTFRVLTASFGSGLELEAQARTLGAGPLQVARRVTLPLALPAILAGGLFAFLVSSNLFLLTFFVGRGGVETLPTLLFSKLAGGGVLDPVAAGLAVLASLPGIFLLLITERFLRGVRVGVAGR